MERRRRKLMTLNNNIKQRIQKQLLVKTKIKTKLSKVQMILMQTTNNCIKRTSQNVEVPNVRKRNINEMSGGSSF